MKMKVRNISNPEKFFKVIDQCDGDVEMNLPDGKSVNLKSKLSLYVSIAKVLSNGNIEEIDLTTHNSKDSERLFRYMVQGS